ncbi:MBL fold metallo-hydrolase [Gemmatimonas sp.]|uniref:MBL fold metallo-hydrolase n=1 Tax=Gemmatimonas sp. TaxID=1962908 RepID=UPI00286C7F11|nr:MBL fold metallo-hydrolase [Gemmatimonas sp.]
MSRMPSHILRTLIAAVLLTAGPAAALAQAAPPVASGLRVCDSAHTATNARFPLHPVSTPWYHVRAVEPFVFAIIEPYQFQEVISWLIVGSQRALLFDSGLGMMPIKPVVMQLTSLPVTVINSHTHFDHVGGNADFADVRAMSTPFTTARMAGDAHASVASEVSPTALCGNRPPGLDTATFRSRPWSAASRIGDGTRFDLGGRVLEVLATPGHTPDAIALLDRTNGLLWTGDSFYAGPIWLFMPETDLEAYQRSMDRLAALVPSLRRVLPAHNVTSVAPSVLARVPKAIRDVRTGRLRGSTPEPGQRLVPFRGFSILVSEKALRTPPSGARARQRVP